MLTYYCMVLTTKGRCRAQRQALEPDTSEDTYPAYSFTVFSRSRKSRGRVTHRGRGRGTGTRSVVFLCGSSAQVSLSIAGEWSGTVGAHSDDQGEGRGLIFEDGDDGREERKTLLTVGGVQCILAPESRTSWTQGGTTAL